jgi:hypothetical protein
MPKNKIQFQRGLSLPDFLASYGTDSQCRETLFRFRWPHGFFCPACGSIDYYQLKTRKLFQCNHFRRRLLPVERSLMLQNFPYPYGFLEFTLLHNQRLAFPLSVCPEHLVLQ